MNIVFGILFFIIIIIWLDAVLAFDKDAIDAEYEQLKDDNDEV